jgi:integrase
VDTARTKARDVLKDARLGADPQADRKTRMAEAAALTVAGLVTQYLAALHAGTVTSKRLKGRSAGTGHLADVERHLNRFAKEVGNMPAGAIGRGDVVRVLTPYASQPSVHRRMHGAINRLYAWARRHELVTNSPADDIDTTSPPSRERVLTLVELAGIWNVAEQLDPLYRDVIHLMILTGQRRNEIAGMRWSEIDLATGLWTLPTGRTKARRQHVIPLPAAAVEILEARQRTVPGDLVLPTIGRDGKTIALVSGWNWLKRELDRKLTIAPWHLHDFRRSIVTHLAERGIDIALLDSMLNHAASVTRAGVIGVYQKASLIEPMRAAMAVWDDLIRQASSERPAKVIKLRQRKG